MGIRVCMRMSCVSGCVVALNWYLPRTFFRSDVSGAGGWYRGWRFSVISTTYLVLLDVVGSGCGALSCSV